MKKIMKTTLSKISHFIEKSVDVSSKDKFWQIFSARMKSISLSKSLGGSCIDKTNVNCHCHCNASISECKMGNTSSFNISV